MSLIKKTDWDDTVTCSPDRKLCARIDEKNHQLFIFEKNDKKTIATFENVKEFAFSFLGTFLGVLSNDETFFIWNTQTQKMSAVIKKVDEFSFCNLYNTKKDTIKNFFSGKKPKNVTYADLNIFFK